MGLGANANTHSLPKFNPHPLRAIEETWYNLLFGGDTLLPGGRGVFLKKVVANIKEKETNFLVEEGNLEELPPLPPEPHVILLYKDGTGNVVGEGVTKLSWEDSGLVEKITGEIQELEERLERIPRQLKRLSRKKRKHGGRYPSKRELREIRKKRERLIQQQEGIPETVSQKWQTINDLGKKVEENLPKSHPFNPLKIWFIRKIKVEGEPLSPADQAWWFFVRYVDQARIWGLLREGQQREYNIVYGFFIRRFAVREAKGWSTEKEEKAVRKLDDFMSEHLSDIPEEDYKRIGPILSSITTYFSE